MKKRLSFFALSAVALLVHPAHSQPPSDLPPSLQLRSHGQKDKISQDNQKKPALSRVQVQKCAQRYTQLDLEFSRLKTAAAESAKRASETEERRKQAESESANVRNNAEAETAAKKISKINAEITEYNIGVMKHQDLLATFAKSIDSYNDDCAGRSYATGLEDSVRAQFGSTLLPKLNSVK